MKSLDRRQIDRLVGQLEADAYGMALELVRDREQAAGALVEAFGKTAPDFPRRPQADLKRRLRRLLGRALAGGDGSFAGVDGTAAVPVPDRLHTQLVDVVEEHQQDEPLGARKRFLAAIGGVLLVGLLAGFLFVRWTALQAAQPTVEGSNPTANATEIPVQGNLWLRFGKAPSGKPSIVLEPSDGTLEAADWDGHTVLVSYSGLHLAHSYSMTVMAEYKSKYGDIGHFIRRFPFRTEGYPYIVSIQQSQDASGTFRDGQLLINFNHRPPVDPVIAITPYAPGLRPGFWSGVAWTVNYVDLPPLTTYKLTIAVNYGVPKANIEQVQSFTTEPGPPASGVPVIWYSNSPPDYSSNTPQRFVALDWSGHVVGTTYQHGVVGQTRDGAMLASQDGSFYDLNGNPLTPPGQYIGTVADDSRTVCAVESTGARGEGPYSLIVGPIGGSLRQVATLQSVAGAYPGLLACSVSQNRAVLADGQVTGTAGVRLIALSSGRVLYQHAYTGTLPSSIIASRDCRYVAEQLQPVDAQGQPVGWSTVIRRTSDGVIVARLPYQRVVTFSWDDARVVTAPLAGAAKNEVELLNWQTGQVLWQKSLVQDISEKQLVLGVAQPNGPAVAVAIASQPLANGGVDQLWLVGKDGAATQALNGTFYSPILNFS